jgi:tRNA(His) guanylyltransferase
MLDGSAVRTDRTEPMTRTDSLGDRCKSFESAIDQHAMPGLPLLARLDGRAFHTFTRDLERPYDAGMSRAMIQTAAFLVEELHAKVAYTQSDEITLAWYFPANANGTYPEFPFDGRIQKLASVLAGAASAEFGHAVREHLPAKADARPHFDCRVWQVPYLSDALDVFVWREDDATKNSITMAASAYYSHRELQGKHSGDKHEMLHAKGVNWNDYPAFFKRGTYLQRRRYETVLSEEARMKIPEKYRPAPDEKVTRSQVFQLRGWYEMPPIRRCANAMAVLFENALPEERRAA